MRLRCPAAGPRLLDAAGTTLGPKVPRQNATAARGHFETDRTLLGISAQRKQPLRKLEPSYAGRQRTSTPSSWHRRSVSSVPDTFIFTNRRSGNSSRAICTSCGRRGRCIHAVVLCLGRLSEMHAQDLQFASQTREVRPDENQSPQCRQSRICWSAEWQTVSPSGIESDRQDNMAQRTQQPRAASNLDRSPERGDKCRRGFLERSRLCKLGERRVFSFWRKVTPHERGRLLIRQHHRAVLPYKGLLRTLCRIRRSWAAVLMVTRFDACNFSHHSICGCKGHAQLSLSQWPPCLVHISKSGTSNQVDQYVHLLGLNSGSGRDDQLRRCSRRDLLSSLALALGGGGVGLAASGEPGAAPSRWQRLSLRVSLGQAEPGWCWTRRTICYNAA